MKYLKIVTVFAMMNLVTQVAVGQNYGDQAKKMGKEKGKELKAEGQEKVADLKEKGKAKGQEKIDKLTAKGQEKVAGITDKTSDKVSDLTGKANGTAAIESKASAVKGMKFENEEGLSGAALSMARTKFAEQKADASISNINAMNNKASSGQAKIDAAQQRLDASKSLTGEDALTEEDIAAKQMKIDVAKEKLNGFKSSMSSGMTKATAKQSIGGLVPVK